MLSVTGLAILSFLSCAYMFDKTVNEFSRANYHGNIITKKRNLKIVQDCLRQKKGRESCILELVHIQREFSVFTITVYFSRTQYYLSISFLNSCLIHVLVSPRLLQRKQLFSLYELLYINYFRVIIITKIANEDTNENNNK